MADEEYIGLDIGGARVGVARASVKAGLAEPLAVWPAREALAELSKLIKNKTIAGVVAGLPRNLNGDDTSQTLEVRRWIDGAKQKLKTDFFWQDEALTSQSALKQMGATHDNLDAMAAALILQDFMDTPPAGRQRA